MYDRILFPTDGSDPATAVHDYVLEIASAHDATVHVLNVADTTHDSVTRIQGQVVDVLEPEGERIVDEVAASAREAGVDVVTDVRQGVPHETIVEYAGANDVDLIVMPTHGRSGIERYLLGSVTERVVNTSAVPVLTVTPSEGGEFEYPPRTVLVPTDGSRGAQLALDRGIDLANETGATLHVLHVVETSSLGIDVRSAIADDQLEERANEILAAATETARESSVEAVTSSVVHGQPVKEIRSYVEDNDVDVVALGTQGETDFSRYVLGGVSAKLIRTSPSPVLMVRAPEDD